MKSKIGNRLLAGVEVKNKPYEVHDTELHGFLLRIQPSGAMSYYFSYRLADGRRLRTLIGKTTQVTPWQARERAKQISADVIKGKDPQAAKRLARARTLRAFIENDYAMWAQAHSRSPDVAVKRLGRFKEFFDRPLSDLTTWTIEKWQAQRKKAGIRATTINRDIGALKGLLSKAVEWGVLEQHPLSRLKLLKTDRRGRIRYLSDDEELRLRTALDNRENRIREGRESGNLWRKDRGYPEYPSLKSAAFVDHIKPMVLIAMNTGLRRGELFSLKWEDVNFGPNPQITVSGAISKSGQTGHVPLNKEALATLKAWCEQQGAPTQGLVFVSSKTGKCLTHLKTAWAAILSDAKISDFRWHDLRHHFASSLVMRGADLNTVRELLRHGDLQMTIRYAHLSPKAKADAVALLNQVARSPRTQGGRHQDLSIA